MCCTNDDSDDDSDDDEEDDEMDVDDKDAEDVGDIHDADVAIDGPNAKIEKLEAAKWRRPLVRPSRLKTRRQGFLMSSREVQTVEHAGQACDNYYIVVILNHGVLLLRE